MTIRYPCEQRQAIKYFSGIQKVARKWTYKPDSVPIEDEPQIGSDHFSGT